MGWFKKLIKGSSHRSHQHRRYEDSRVQEEPRHSVDSSGFDKEEVECAIALSISEQDIKGKRVIEVESEYEEEGEEDEEEDDDEEYIRAQIEEEDDDEEYIRAQIEEEERRAQAQWEEEEARRAKVKREEEARRAKAQQEEEERCAKAQREEERRAKAQREEEERRAKAQREEERRAKAQWEEEERRAKARQEEEERKMLAQIEEEEQRRRAKAQLEEDEQLAKALQESLTVDSPPRHYGGSSFQPFPFFFSSGSRICAGCNAEIGHGRYLSCMGGVWHPECFRCYACKLPITDIEFSMSGNRPYHKHCYKELNHPRCDVCSNFIPTNLTGLIEYRAHPFWMQKYCPSHERDGTPRCCSCERMEPRDTRYLSLDDGRKLCLECLDSAIMDTHECQPLYLEIQEFYEGLNMKVEQQVPLLLVERQALNEAMEGEKNGHHHFPETRGLCLSEEQTVTTVLRRPRIGAGYRFIDMITEPYRLIRRCEVTAILILYGLPRLLTGSILAHEMMHAWLRLNGYPNLSPEVEEGVCQVLAHMWLDSEIYSGSGSEATSSSSSAASSSSSSPSSSSTSSKKGKRSDFEKKLGEFFKHQIESDTSSAYGDGFREGNQAVNKYGLRRTLDHIRLTGSFPC